VKEGRVLGLRCLKGAYPSNESSVSELLRRLRDETASR
jgi:hypothetical protein